MLADGGRGAFAEGVEQADGVGLAGELPDVGLVGPVEGGYLIVGGELAAGDLAAEDDGDDAARIVASGPSDHRARPLVFLGLHRCDLVGRTGFEPVTSSVSVQGSYLVGCYVLVTGDSGDEPGRVVVRSRCCHFCCHRLAGRPEGRKAQPH